MSARAIAGTRRPRVTWTHTHHMHTYITALHALILALLAPSSVRAYIAGTSEKCHQGLVQSYGSTHTRSYPPATVTVCLDLDAGTLAFNVDNRLSLGVAFNVHGPVHLAVSLFGAGARLGLLVDDQLPLAAGLCAHAEGETEREGEGVGGETRLQWYIRVHTPSGPYPARCTNTTHSHTHTRSHARLRARAFVALWDVQLPGTESSVRWWLRCLYCYCRCRWCSGPHRRRRPRVK